MYNDLATIESTDDWKRLTKVLARVYPTERAWIGLYNDVDSWRWSLDDLPLKNITLRKWASGEPNNANGDQSCVYMNYLGKWFDDTCIDIKLVICLNGESTA